MVYYHYNRSRDSEVGIAMDYGLEAAVRLPVGEIDFSLFHSVQTDF
jgi:hypothetical protein